MLKQFLSGLLLGAAFILCTGCASNEPEPSLPESEHSDMPWNTPRPGEGSGAFGGVFDQMR